VAADKKYNQAQLIKYMRQEHEAGNDATKKFAASVKVDAFVE